MAIISTSDGGSSSSGNKTIWQKIGDFFKKILKPANLPIFGEKEDEGGGSYDSKNDPYYINKDKKLNASSAAIDYITSLSRTKTFDEWLKEQGLSRNDKDDNYFGSFYKKNAKALAEQAYSDKVLKASKINRDAEIAGSQSQNSYRQASSNFSGNSERMFQNGLNKSGFSNYLDGLTYLAYRDEMAKNKLNKSDALTNSENAYDKSVTEIKTNADKSISDREKELYNLYLKELETNKKLYAGLK